MRRRRSRNSSDRSRSSSNHSSSSSDSSEFKRLYQRQLVKSQKSSPKKKQMIDVTGYHPRVVEIEDRVVPQVHKKRKRQRQRSRSRQKQLPIQIRWHIYEKCPLLHLKERVKKPFIDLPIYKKKQQILSAIIKNQFVLVTGETGCGKSTQVPRLIYEYLKNTNSSGKILCVQPRRLAVLNLFNILKQQFQDPSEENVVGYQIGMKSFISPANKIAFMTNGIFLQRMIHKCDFLNEYPFLILDEVHERDIDTDFILLSIKRIVREYPKLRVILMSATIDNDLFRFYFAEDHIENILKEENFYRKVMFAHNSYRQNSEEIEEERDSQEQEKYYKKYELEFLKAKKPCPSINVTQTCKYDKQYFYLDTLNDFLGEGVSNNKWGGIIFSNAYPSMNKELYESVNLIINQVVTRKDAYNPCSFLIFLPGLAEIENLSESINHFFAIQGHKQKLEIIHVHSTLLNDEVTRSLHTPSKKRFKIFLATNIAQSSVTISGVKYVIDFCLTKEVKFDLKSRMENLQLMWASKASCQQRAGRTGRVCNGFVFRLLEKNFYQKLQEYSTPEIQRSSLDKLILRIKMLHQNQQNTKIFQDPGEVLGSAIQPPHLKNIDTSIKNLVFCGGLQFDHIDNFNLTNLGRLFIEIPIDITYCKLLLLSKIFGTYDDILILVAILSQSKNIMKKYYIERDYISYYDMIENDESCDFRSLVSLFKKKKQKQADYQSKNKFFRGKDIDFEIYPEVKQLIYDIERRISKKQINYYFNKQSQQYLKYKKQWKKFFKNSQEQYTFRFRMTLMCGFIQNILKIFSPSYDERQDKRIRHMKQFGISNKNTVVVLKPLSRLSNHSKQYNTEQAQQHIRNDWIDTFEKVFKIPEPNFTITKGLNYIHFRHQRHLNRFLFYKHMEDSRRVFSDDSSSYGITKPKDVFTWMGDVDHMQVGRAVTFYKEQTVAIDNLSLNRVVNLNEGQNTKFLICNNIAKQSSRMITRYTSLLPAKMKHLDILAHLLFYPFVSIQTNKKENQYSYLILKKKHKLKIKFELTNEEIKEVNEIRSKIRTFFQLNSKAQNLNFTEVILIMKFIFKERKQIIEQEKWLESFIQETGKNNQTFKNSFKEMFIQDQKNSKIKIQGTEEKDRMFMNELNTVTLKPNFFSNIEISGLSYFQRLKMYNQWKKKKLRSVKELQEKATNHLAYLVCGEFECGLRIAPMNKVGGIVGQIYRQLFDTVEENIIPQEFDATNHFCTLLTSNYIDVDYSLFSCSNGHYLAVRLQQEKQLKILPFSPLVIEYPDGSIEQAAFNEMEVKHWKKKELQKMQNKFKIDVKAKCFICHEEICSFKDLEFHIKDSYHIENVQQFKKTFKYEKEIQEKLEEEEEPQ